MTEVNPNPAPETPKPETPAPEAPKPETPADVVARADHERALADMHKFKKEAERLKSERDADKTNKMKEQAQWKELAEAKEREATEAKAEGERLKTSYVGEKKFNAVRGACEKLGLRAEAIQDLELVDFSEIQAEHTSTGRTNILGADKFAERLKSIRPHWFADKAAPKVNTDGTRVVDSTTVITPVMLLEAEKRGKKSGDLSEYTSLFHKYRSQLSAKKAAH